MAKGYAVFGFEFKAFSAAGRQAHRHHWLKLVPLGAYERAWRSDECLNAGVATAEILAALNASQLFIGFASPSDAPEAAANRTVGSMSKFEVRPAGEGMWALVSWTADGLTMLTAWHARARTPRFVFNIHGHKVGLTVEPSTEVGL